MKVRNQNSLKWVPNAISILRGTLLSIFVLLCAIKGYWLAASIFAVIAFASDALDGWLAFKLNAKTELGGKVIDPLCDLCFSVALIAGAFFNKMIGWNFIFCLIFVFAIVQIGKSRKRKWQGWQFLAEAYYIVVAIYFLGIYFYKAMRLAVIWLIILAIPIMVWIFWKRSQRNKKNM